MSFLSWLHQSKESTTTDPPPSTPVATTAPSLAAATPGSPIVPVPPPTVLAAAPSVAAATTMDDNNDDTVLVTPPCMGIVLRLADAVGEELNTNTPHALRLVVPRKAAQSNGQVLQWILMHRAPQFLLRLVLRARQRRQKAAYLVQLGDGYDILCLTEGAGRPKDVNKVVYVRATIRKAQDDEEGVMSSAADAWATLTTTAKPDQHVAITLDLGEASDSTSDATLTDRTRVLCLNTHTKDVFRILKVQPMTLAEAPVVEKKEEEAKKTDATKKSDAAKGKSEDSPDTLKKRGRPKGSKNKKKDEDEGETTTKKKTKAEEEEAPKSTTKKKKDKKKKDEEEEEEEPKKKKKKETPSTPKKKAATTKKKATPKKKKEEPKEEEPSDDDDDDTEEEE